MATRMTEAEKQDIATRHTAGEPTAEIARAIDRSERTVRRYLPTHEPEPESQPSVIPAADGGGGPPAATVGDGPDADQTPDGSDESEVEKAATVAADDPTNTAPTKPEPSVPSSIGPGETTVEARLFAVVDPFIEAMAEIIEADDELRAAFELTGPLPFEDPDDDQFENQMLEMMKGMSRGFINRDRDRPDDEQPEPQLTAEEREQLSSSAFCRQCERALWQGGPPTESELPLECQGGRQAPEEMPAYPIATCGITVLDLVVQISTPAPEDAQGLPSKFDCACGVNLWDGGAPNSSEFPLISSCSQVWVQLDDGSIEAANGHADDNDEISEGFGCPVLKEA